jgi:hypothetical protein
MSSCSWIEDCPPRAALEKKMSWNPTLDRRQFLWQSGGGLGGIALACLLAQDDLLASTGRPGPGGLHHPAKARRVVQLFMSGAASQCDTFDYKPALIRRHGEPFDPGGPIELFQSNPGTYMKSPWRWRQHGQCGKWVSDLVPQIASCVDDIAFLPAMVSRSNVHGPATFMQNTGFVSPGFPSMGAWISYGLGSESRNLPAFVVLPDARGFAPNGPANWSAGFLPASFQGTTVRASDPNPIVDLFPGPNQYINSQSERDSLRVLEQMNRRHQEARPGDSRLDARIASYELAARLQASAPEVVTVQQSASKAGHGLPAR